MSFDLFLTTYGSTYGVFDSFKDAIQAAPANSSTHTFDNDSVVNKYSSTFDHHAYIKSYDTPLLDCLKNIIHTSSHPPSIFDFGGNLGILYRKFFHELNEPEWLVCEMPKIVKLGEEIARKHSYPKLSFTSQFDLLDGKDIFLASGSIQYVEDFKYPHEKIGFISTKPKHILINRIILCPNHQYVTLQNAWKDIYFPVHIYSEPNLIEGFKSMGYEIQSKWNDDEDNASPFFNQAPYSSRYYGIYFKLKE